jgi:glutathione S-transferase
VSAASILYSFRRCPYAIRARLALTAAGLRPGVDLELREVNLKARPPELLEASPRATVPVLVTAEGEVLAESLAIMQWALHQADPGGWWAGRSTAERAVIEALIAENDGAFKHHLDRFKYPDRYPGETSGEAAAAEAGQEAGQAAAHHRLAALAILRRWNARLAGLGDEEAQALSQRGAGWMPACGGWLLGDRPCLADMALLPFVRQFRLADPAGLDAEPDLGDLQVWLQRFLASPELAAVMEAPWGLRQSWRSPRWLYHLALADEWRAARRDGLYARSTRGLSLQEVGFIHASQAHQLEDTCQRFYADAGDVVLLHIDPERLAAAGVPVRLEPAPGSGELFPHLYGGLPLPAVRLVERYP